MLGGISSMMTGILFTLITSIGKPANTTMFCYGVSGAGIRVCLETVTEDQEIRARGVMLPVPAPADGGVLAVREPAGEVRGKN